MSGASGTSTVKIIVIAAVSLAVVVMVAGMAFGMATNMGHHGSAGPAQTPFVTSGSNASVDMRGFAFSPYDLTIDAGATVTWTNHDNAPHDAVSDDGDFRTELLQDGESADVTFDEAGRFPYHCSVHPYMKGTVTVR